MKLAEALQERADLNRKIEELRRRLANVILVQEGEEPAEEPAELLKELKNSTSMKLYKEAGYHFRYVYYSTKNSGTKVFDTTFRQKDYQ